MFLIKFTTVFCLRYGNVRGTNVSKYLKYIRPWNTELVRESEVQRYTRNTYDRLDT